VGHALTVRAWPLGDSGAGSCENIEGRLSGRPFCLTAGTGWCALSPSRRFLNAIGMDHVLTSITCFALVSGLVFLAARLED
jgi:hypothetical protein